MSSSVAAASATAFAGVHDHALDLQVLHDRVEATGAAEAAVLVAAEGRAYDAGVAVGVDVDLAGLELAHERLGSADVVRPDGGSEAVLGAVSDLDRFVRVREAEDGEYGAKDLLLGDTHIGLDFVEEGRLDEEAAVVD